MALLTMLSLCSVSTIQFVNVQTLATAFSCLGSLKQPPIIRMFLILSPSYFWLHILSKFTIQIGPFISVPWDIGHNRKGGHDGHLIRIQCFGFSSWRARDEPLM